MENNDYNDSLEKLLIEKSCNIGYLTNENREKSLEISKLKKMVRQLINEKLQIKSSDDIVLRLNQIYNKFLKRDIDSEGLLLFYPQIKNGKLEYAELEKQIQESIEFKILQKMPKTETAFNYLPSE